MSEVRRYGFFQCWTCDRRWESANTWCQRGDYEALYGQECAECPSMDMVYPYRVERLKCPYCGSNMGCNCFDDSDDDEDSDNERHTDPTKAHRADLCGRCLSGNPCTSSYDGDDDDDDTDEDSDDCMYDDDDDYDEDDDYDDDDDEMEEEDCGGSYNNYDQHNSDYVYNGYGYDMNYQHNYYDYNRYDAIDSDEEYF